MLVGRRLARGPCGEIVEAELRPVSWGSNVPVLMKQHYSLHSSAHDPCTRLAFPLLGFPYSNWREGKEHLHSQLWEPSVCSLTFLVKKQ